MVYPGGPSKGCYTCRARKVKCDESRPACTRCIKGKRVCGGYRNLNDQMTPRRSIGPASQQGEHVAKLLAKFSIFPTTILGHSPEEERNNVCAFVKQIARLPQGLGVHGGLLDEYPAVLDGLGPSILASSPLPSALSALFLMFVSDRRDERYRGALTEAMASYGRALQLTRRLMEELVEPRRLELVLTIFTLGMYEDLNFESRTKVVANSHLEGAMAFVRSQKCKPFGADTTRKIYSALLNRSMFTCFEDYRSNNPFIFTLNDLQLLHAGLVAETPPDYPNIYKSALLKTHLQIRQLEKETWLSFPSDSASPISPTRKINALLEELASLETDMAAWPDTLQPDEKYVVVQIPLDDNPDIWSTEAYVYSSLTAGNAWLRYRTLLLLLLSLRLRAYRLLADPIYRHGHVDYELGNTLPTDIVSGLSVTHSKTRTVVDEICASMPFHLGYLTKSGTGRRYPTECFPQGKYPHRLHGCNVAWPVYVAGIVEGVDTAQRLWISRQLVYLDGELGVGKVRMLAEQVRNVAMSTESMS
ncbi:hypothetical protein BDV18DRAFT_21127 [Aspergillus unguis]